MPPRRSKRVQERDTQHRNQDDEGRDNSIAAHARRTAAKVRRTPKKAELDKDKIESNNTFNVPFGDKHIVCQRYDAPPHGDETNGASLIFTHGAGGGISNPAVVDFAHGFSSTETILCFEGSMNLKNRIKYFQAVLDGESAATALGGRSMGARAATITATERADQIQAVILSSFPMTSGQTGDSREQILLDLPGSIKVLFITGDRDSMCETAKLQEVRSRMAARSWAVVVEGADHSMSLKPKRAVNPIRVKTGQMAAQWLRNPDGHQMETVVRWNDETSKVEVSEWQPNLPTDGPAQKRQRKT